jgi:hypothetical protein
MFVRIMTEPVLNYSLLLATSMEQLSTCIFGSEEGGNKFLRDINELLLDYTASQPIRQ